MQVLWWVYVQVLWWVYVQVLGWVYVQVLWWVYVQVLWWVYVPVLWWVYGLMLGRVLTRNPDASFVNLVCQMYQEGGVYKVLMDTLTDIADEIKMG